MDENGEREIDNGRGIKYVPTFTPQNNVFELSNHFDSNKNESLGNRYDTKSQLFLNFCMLLTRGQPLRYSLNTNENIPIYSTDTPMYFQEFLIFLK